MVLVDDIHLPLYRVVWVSDLPHFCGEEDCIREGYYEIRLEADESLWTSVKGRDIVLNALKEWIGDEDENDSPY